VCLIVFIIRLLHLGLRSRSYLEEIVGYSVNVIAKDEEEEDGP
jgi:hypothetical protein